MARLIKVKNAKLCEVNGKYYIDVTYICEDDHVIEEVNIPKMRIPLEQWTGDVDIEYSGSPSNPPTYRARLGNLSLPLSGNAFDMPYTEKIIKEKATEMTIEEIEKKLGYRVKIVSNKK